MRIGVLALQGDFAEHLAVLRRLGAECRLVRLPDQLDGLDGLILPGGESTTIGKLAATFQLVEPLRRFVLPGGSAGAAAFHLARTVCRRAERRVVALGRREPLEPVAVRFLNRLSDLLFVLARVENRREGRGDVEWSPRAGE